MAGRGRAVQLAVGGDRVLVHELVVANGSQRDVTLRRLDVASGGRIVAQWRDEALGAIAADADRNAGAAPSLRVVAAGETVVLYLWIELTGGTPAPPTLDSWLTVIETGAAGPVERVIRGPGATLLPPAVVVAAPVRGGRWFVSNGYGNDTNHRRFIVDTGRLLIPQRFGADFLKLADDGNNATAQRPLRNEVFHAFDEPVYAVADGRVHAVRRGFPDNEAGAAPPALSRQDSPGNHVMIQIGQDVYALYAHLRAGSIRVEPDQMVTKGQLIGRIGNSGNTSAPHLHFHLSRGPSPNESEGVPFVFEGYEVLVENYTFSPGQLPFPSTGRPERGSVPRARWVVRFPE